MKHSRSRILIGMCLLFAFAVWTVLVCRVNVRPIGPDGSSVGFADFNRAVHTLTGVHLFWYTLTDLLSVIPLLVCVGFGALGLWQWIRRKRITKVDPDVLALGVLYLVTIAVFVGFERFPVNYRPVLLDGILEASYPSSTTMLVMCVMPTAAIQCHRRIRHTTLHRIVVWFTILFTIGMVAARILSGVHWVTDILGGVLFSAGLVTLYSAIPTGGTGSV